MNLLLIAAKLRGAAVYAAEVEDYRITVAVVGFLAAAVPSVISGYFSYRSRRSTDSIDSRRADLEEKLGLIDQLQEEVQRLAAERDKLQQTVDQLRRTLYERDAAFLDMRADHAREMAKMQASIDELLHRLHEREEG